MQIERGGLSVVGFNHCYEVEKAQMDQPSPTISPQRAVLECTFDLAQILRPAYLRVTFMTLFITRHPKVCVSLCGPHYTPTASHILMPGSLQAVILPGELKGHLEVQSK